MFCNTTLLKDLRTAPQQLRMERMEELVHEAAVPRVVPRASPAREQSTRVPQIEPRRHGHRALDVGELSDIRCEKFRPNRCRRFQDGTVIR